MDRPTREVSPPGSRLVAVEGLGGPGLELPVGPRLGPGPRRDVDGSGRGVALVAEVDLGSPCVRVYCRETGVARSY